MKQSVEESVEEVVKPQPDEVGWWRVRDESGSTLHFHYREDGKVKIFGGKTYMDFDWLYAPTRNLQCVKVYLPGP